MLQTDYRLVALIDWIELKIQLRTRTNGWTLNQWAIDNLGVNTYFDPQDAGTGGAASVFAFRIQEAQSWDSVAAALAQINVAYPFRSLPTITGIEVSMDAYIDGASIGDLARLTAHRFRFSQSRVSENFRFAGRSGRKGDSPAPTIHNLFPMLRAGRVIAIGEFGGKTKGLEPDPITMRFYVKTTDQNGRVKLFADRWRSRGEVTLTGEALPFTSIEEARRFDFEVLAPHFYVRAEKPGLSNLQKLILAARVRPGAKRIMPIKRRSHSSSTIADKGANDAAYQALKKLTRSMNPKQRGGHRVAGIRAAECKKSDTLNP